MGNKASTPLSSAALHILLAIGPAERHGYAIMSEVERITDGSVKMGPGTLYGTIKRLLSDGLLEECTPTTATEHDDERRRYYRLTAQGQTMATAEVGRMEALLRRSGARTWTAHQSTR